MSAVFDVVLLKAMFLVGAQFPGKPEKCRAVFHFSLLYAPGRRAKKAAGPLTAA